MDRTGGSVALSPCSPDLIQLGLYFRGHMKSLVYETPVDSAENLMAIIVISANKMVPMVSRWCISYSFPAVTCAMTAVVNVLTICCEFFPQTINLIVQLLVSFIHLPNIVVNSHSNSNIPLFCFSQEWNAIQCSSAIIDPLDGFYHPFNL
ncbi:hypothetical protein TNCV_2205871 [Trichonephila clavipes]|nr:hypothetical protein TNCV_2205871 [Trichonephila clavipes]